MMAADGGVLGQIGAAIGRAARERGPAVVGVGGGSRPGTGTVIAPGRVVTSAGNLRRGEATVSFGPEREETGEALAVDRDLGLAVVGVDTVGVEPLEWPDEDPEPEIGTPVIALANPGGRGLRATPGFVSAPGRSFRGSRGRRIRDAVEHTAPLPRGSSGGPLLDAEGGLIGFNAIRLEGGLIVALGANAELRENVDRLAGGETPARGHLGVAVAPPRAARRMRRAVGLPERDGLLVRAVEDGSPAERAGIAQGDLIVAAGDTEVDGVDALHTALDEAASRLSLTVIRGTDERELKVELNGGAK